MSTRKMFFILIYWYLVPEMSVANMDLEVCENAEINKPCEITCLYNCTRNCSVCFYYEDDFGYILESYCSTDFSCHEDNTCQIRKRTDVNRNRISYVLVLDPLLYEHYGEWFCGSDNNFSRKTLLEPYYLDLNRTAVIPTGISHSTHHHFLLGANIYLRTMIEIYIPCAYPRPSVTVALETAFITCILCDIEASKQFLEICEITGHIGSYNFTCDVSKTLRRKKVLCVYFEHRIITVIQQRGYTTGIIVLNESLTTAEEELKKSERSFQMSLGHIFQQIGFVLLSLWIGYLICMVVKRKKQKDRPSVPNGPLVENITDSSITLKWSKCEDDGGSPIQHYIIECFSEKNILICQKTTKTTFTLESLEENTTYSISIRAENEYGFSAKVFLNSPVTTKGRPPIPNGVLVEKITDSSITLTWNKCENDGGDPIKHYIIECSSEKGFPICQKTTKTKFIVGCLEEKKTYSISMQAENKYGVSEKFFLNSPVTTKGRPSVPNGLLVENITDSSITLKWSKCEDDGGSPIQHYIISCTSEKRNLIYEKTTKTEVILGALEEKTTYSISIQARNEYGVSAKCFPDSPVTTKGRPSVPNGLCVENITDSSIKLTWSKCEDDGGSPIKHYIIECSSEKNILICQKTTKTEFTLGALEEKTTYSISIQAENEYGLSEKVFLNSPVTTKEQDMVSLRKNLLVVAIDFGTTFSGYAFSSKHDYETNPLKIYANKSWMANTSQAGLVSWKTPTTLLLNSVMEFEAFGYEAEEIYYGLMDNDDHYEYHYFSRFKMMLYDKKTINRDVMIEDADDRPFPAKTVFTHSIRYLKDHLLETLKKQSLCRDPDKMIQWVLTIPAIWNEPAKQFMREAALEAGIPSNKLTLALESEAASLLCKYIPTERSDASNIIPFQIGTRYIVLDLGGGTVDATVHEVEKENTLREIHKASGGAWGGTTVDDAFMKVIREIFGDETIEEFKQKQHTGMLEFQRDFELKKRNIRDVVKGSKQKPVVISIPARLGEIHTDITGKSLEQSVRESKICTIRHENKLSFDREELERMFEQAKHGIVGHLKKILMIENVGEKISVILLVGGFAASKIIVDAVKEAFPNLRVVVPPDPGLAVVKGAVIYGHAPLSIASRVCKYTYGVGVLYTFIPNKHPEHKKVLQNGEELCKDVFDKFIEIGENVKAEEVIHRNYDVTSYNKPMEIQVFASANKHPLLTSDADCHLLGKIKITPPDGGWKKDATINVRMEFGRTEFRVMAVDSQNKENTYETSFDFLGDSVPQSSVNM